MLDKALMTGDPYAPQPARLLSVEPMYKDHALFRFRFEDEATNRAFAHKPGQFVMLSVLGVGEAPISISSSPTRPGSIELMVRRTGRVTNALHNLRENAVVGLRGPYGNGFPVDELKGHDLLFVAGGLGIAPLRSLLWYVLDRRTEFGDVILMYGGRSTDEFLFENELASLKKRGDIRTMLIAERIADRDKGTWDGPTGMVTDLFNDVALDARDMYAVICGPPVMYKFVLIKLLERDFSKDKILMSLERKMKCGVGKCAHCLVGSKYTCMHGPIFTYWDAMQLPEMI